MSPALKFTATEAKDDITDSYVINCNGITAQGTIETTLFGPFKRDKDECHLSDLVKTLDRMNKAYPDDTFNPVQSDYENVAGYLGWFDSEYDDAESLYDEYPEAEVHYTDYAAVANVAKRFGGMAMKWPREPLTGYDTPTKFHSYEILYFDKNRVKHTIQVEFD